MNYSALLAQINANIKRNGVQAITGQILNAVLRAMVESLGEGFRFGGFALPEDAPESPTFYLLRDGDVIKIKTYTDGSWDETEVVDLADYGKAEDVAELRTAVENIIATTYTKSQVDGKLSHVVHKAGDEDISGHKNFKDGVFLLDGELLLDSFSDDGNGMQSVADLYLSSEFEHIHLHDYDRDADEERDIDDLIGTIFSKADSSNVYTKSQVDDFLSDVAHGSDLQDLEDYVNRDFAKKADTYTKTETDGLLATKANQSTTYTKTEVDGELATKADSTDLTALSGRVDGIEAVIGDINGRLTAIVG